MGNKKLDIALEMKLHHCRADDNHHPSHASHTVSLTQMVWCCWLMLSTTSTSTLAPLQQNGYSKSPPNTYKCTGLFHLRHRSLYLAQFPKFFWWLNPSSFSKFLCTEVLPFSIWTTFPNLELSPDVLRTCFRTLNGLQRIFWTVWASVLILLVSRYQLLASSG